MAIGSKRPLGPNSAARDRAVKARAFLCLQTVGLGIGLRWNPQVPDTILLPDSLGPLHGGEVPASVCVATNASRPENRTSVVKLGWSEEGGLR
jgi:hypothetical protein